MRTLVILALGRQRREDNKSSASVDNTARVSELTQEVKAHVAQAVDLSSSSRMRSTRRTNS